MLQDVASTQSYEQQQQALYGTYTTEYEEVPTYVYVDASQLQHQQQQLQQQQQQRDESSASAEYQQT